MLNNWRDMEQNNAILVTGNNHSKVETATSRETGSHFSVPQNTHETGKQGTCDSHTVQANSTSTGTM